MTRQVRLTSTVTHEGGRYVARCVQVEVASQGRTIREALDQLREALELYFEDERPPGGDEAPAGPVEVRDA
ncbi:type II toxin-antitoxin system HicB family antitoxin [Streptomyces eurocidicus]|uniref:Putative RNase H-like HicB family nuclease n=1 Tax=Streptomyces eurocidicus TaxID=66423 RepID=A0A7W8F1H5_STREU|nr:type II toxin-antitoxin system HicB family antitoxin [Streptomyces eurocidicus]MBB5119673.1 putative RNase H-like HicB family nuclease [Streptomyces eurocidicus]MBF6050700.1 type II toxin-antitoxin system HicB family antitoxin [Streptomyces eurocidicus]